MCNLPGIADIAGKRLLPSVYAFMALLVLLSLELLATVDTVILADVKVVIFHMSTQ